MGIWKTTTINETPQIELARWCVYEVDSEHWPGRTRHFCGYNLTEREGRVSSAIVFFDKESMTGRTNSGRVYKLVGNSSYDGDASYVWSYFVERNDISEIVDVSDEMKK